MRFPRPMTQTQGANRTLPHTRHLINPGQKAARKALNPGSICLANLGVRECVRVFSCRVDVYKILIRLCILEQKWKYVFSSSSSPVMILLPRGTLKLHTQYSVSREKY